MNRNYQLLFLGLVLGLCVMCAKDQNLAGNASEVENSYVVGKVVKQDGTPASHTEVKILSCDFNPADSSREGMSAKFDTTDASGSYSFHELVTGEYNIEAIGVLDRTRLLIRQINVTGDTSANIPADTLRKPGSIRVSLSKEGSPNGYLYIPGTSRFVQLNQAMIDSGYAVLDSVPAGIIPQILYADPDSASMADTVAKDVRVASDSTTEAAMNATYTVSKALAAPVIDGDLSEFSLAAPILLRDTAYSAQCTVRILWDDSALYIGAEVKDSLLNVVPGLAGEQIVNMDDAIEVMFDPEGDRGDFLDGDDAKYYVNVLSRRADAKFQDTTWNSSWKTSVVYHGTVNDNSDIDTGYTVEIAIPWGSVLLQPPVIGKQLVVDIALDNDNGFVNEWTQTPWSNKHFVPNFQWVNIPKYWGKLVLK